MKQPVFFLILCTVVLGSIFLILKNFCPPFEAFLLAVIFVLSIMFVVIQLNRGIEHFVAIPDVSYATQYNNLQLDGQIYNPDPANYPILTNMMFKGFKLNGNTNGRIFNSTT